MSPWYSRKDGVVTLVLHVQPGAKRTGVVGLHGGVLKVRLAAPPIDGRANDVLLRFIADSFDVPLRNVELKQGVSSRDKVVRVYGSALEPEELFKF